MQWKGRLLLRTGAAAILVVLAAACVDTPELPTLAPPSTAPLDVGYASKVGSDGEWTKDAKVKRYRLKVNHKRKMIEAETEFVTSSTIIPSENCLEPDGCADVSIIYSGEFDVSGETSDSTNTGEPWDPVYAEMGEEGTRWHCKQTVDDIKFTHKEYAFVAEGDATYIGPAPSRSWGVVKGKYQLPRGPHLSTNGRAEVISGVVEGLCYFEWTQLGPFLIEGGFFASTKFIGQWRVFRWRNFGRGQRSCGSFSELPGHRDVYTRLGHRDRWSAILLNRVLILAGVALVLAPSAEAQSQRPGATRTGPVMSDTLPYGNRFGFPFTREELKRALLQTRSAEDAEFFVRMVYEPDEEVIGVTTTDVELLLLAAVSSDVAARVVEYKPRLRERVQVVQADPEAFVRVLRSFREVKPLGPGTDRVPEHSLADIDLLLLAALFPDQAAAIAEYAPRLREQVREMQVDPQAFVRLLRSSRKGEPPAPRTRPIRER